MARLIRDLRDVLALSAPLILAIGLGQSLAATPALGREPVEPEVVDPKALEAFKEYWDAFESHETKLVNEGQAKFNQGWQEVKKGYDKGRSKLTQAQLESLQKSAERYRQHLDRHEAADNRPYVMLNLAQILSLIGDHLQKTDGNGGTFARSEALALLGDLARDYPHFSHREQALYLRAAILESLDQSDEALAAWQSLAAEARKTLYGLHARVAVGDHLFRRERAVEAMRAYQKAEELLPALQVDDPEWEKVRIDYRLAWAAYRATELDTVLKAGAELLQPGRRIKSADQREKIQRDAVELMGDALYEANSPARAKELLKRRELHDFAAAIGHRAITRYGAGGIHAEAAALGEWLAAELPLARETPEILQVTADAWGKLGKTPRRLAVLERLALLLPAQSLWRARFKEDLQTIRQMEEKAKAAAMVVATSHYDTGLASGNANAYKAAASFYDVLLDHEANGPDANEWRLRKAHCQYFAGDYEQAAGQYEALKTEHKVNPDVLQLASYQLVLTNERRWREAFAKAESQGENPRESTAVTAPLAALTKSIDEFAARFPGQGRSVDLLLVGASACRDMDRFDEASRYWQRALVLEPTPAQRGLAIRGLVFAHMKTGSAGDVVELTRRFLKLEDWKALGPSLGNELRGVLSSATLDEGRRLNESGKVLEAGLLLTQVAEEFEGLPERDRIYRDGAYMLAIAGDWGQAERAAEGYFKTGLQKNRADMTYLLARAHEYQIRLHEAARRYLELGETHPGHSRAATSLARAEKLALAEGDFALAAAAATALAERGRSPADRLPHFGRAAEHLAKAEKPDQALALARKRLRASVSQGERLTSRLLIARLTYRAGSEQEALDELAILAKQIERAKGRLSSTEYAALVGEVHLLLGDEALRRFEDFRILERGGSLATNIGQKTRFFEDLAAAYDRSAAAGDPRWATEARFKLATAAEGLADEIASIPNKTDETLTLKAKNRYQATIDRLQRLSQKYHSSNVLAARRDPARHRDDEWVKRSSLRLTGETSASPERKHRDLVPTAVQSDLISEWSL